METLTRIGIWNDSTAPLDLAVTVDEAKPFFRIEVSDTSQDTEIETFLRTAQEQVEAYLERALIVRKVWFSFDCKLPRYEFGLSPIDPATLKVTFEDDDEVVTSEAAATDYGDILANPEPAQFRPDSDLVEDWATTKQIKFSANVGYAADTTDAERDKIPQSIKTAIIWRAYDLFEGCGCNSGMGESIKNLLRSLKGYRVCH